MLTNTQKEVLSPETITLIDGGFLTECGKLTDGAKDYLVYLSFKANKKALIARAEEKIAEAKEKQV